MSLSRYLSKLAALVGSDGKVPAAGIAASEDFTFNGVKVGKGAGSVATNTAVGASALNANTTGDRNVAVGYQSLTSITTSSNNIAVGYQAGLLATGGANVLIGRQAGYGSLSTNYNTFVGDQAGLSATTGERNTFIGAGVGSGTVTGSYNVGVGGYDGGGASTLNAAAFSGSRNTAMGSGALQANTTASYNTAVGYQAGYSSTTANSNTLIGNGAGYSLTTGSNNTFVGPATGSGTSGFYVTTGSKNTILGGYNGNQGGLDIRTANNNIVLSDGDGNPFCSYWQYGGVYAWRFSNKTSPYFTNASEVVHIDGTSSGYGLLIAVTSGGAAQRYMWSATGTVVGSVTLSSTATTYNTSSDYRLKNIAGPVTGEEGRQFVMSLEPEQGTWKEDGSKFVGFVAHKFQAVSPTSVTGQKDAVDENGNPVMQAMQASSAEVIANLVAHIQYLETRLAALESKGN